MSKTHQDIILFREMRVKKYFSKPYFFYLALLSFAINLGFTFLLTYLSSIFKFLGAETSQLPFLWLAPPITGLIIQPLIGQLSDDTMTPYGKRRPYIIGWGIVAILSFFLISSTHTLLYALLLTWLISISLNGCLETLRALTTDLSQQKERSKAFAFQGFFGGIGAVIGTGFPYILHKIYLLMDHTHFIALEKMGMPVNFKLSFIAIGIIMGVILFISMRTVKERRYIHQTLLAKKRREKSFSFFKRSIKVFKDLTISLKNSSHLFKKICFIHSVTWLGIFIFWLYFTTVIAQNFYTPSIIPFKPIPSLQYIQVFQKATLDASGYLSIYQIVGIIYALFLFFILEYTEKIKFIHSISLLIGGIGMSTIGLAHTKIMVILSMIGVGIMTGSLAILPYTIVSRILPKGKYGVYLGIFNISITLPQIIAGLMLPPVYIYLFGRHAAYVMVLAGIIIMISAALWLQEAYYSHEIFYFKVEKNLI